MSNNRIITWSGTNTDGTYTQPFLTSELDYIIEHDWSVSLPMWVGHLQDVTGCEAYIAYVNELLDYGVRVWAQIDLPFGYGCDVTDIGSATWAPTPLTDPREVPIPSTTSIWRGAVGSTVTITPDEYHTLTGLWPALWWDTPKIEYHYRFDTCFDLLDATDIEGYQWECGFDHGIEWLRESTTKQLQQHIGYGSIDNPAWSSYLFNYNTIDWRISQCDRILTLPHAIRDIPDTILIGNYVHDHTTKPWDVGAYYLNQILSAGVWYWGASALDEQILLLSRYLNQVKSDTGPFDGVETYLVNTPPGSLYYDTRLTVHNMIDFLESLNLDASGTKKVWGNNSSGLTPSYSGASLCGHPPLPDTFANTGNEIILLKEYTTACAVHEITVTSTDTLTHEDNTITCLPDRGTIIGPYPLDEFGALPTISYDNTNLYVSILKVEPTA